MMQLLREEWEHSLQTIKLKVKEFLHGKVQREEYDPQKFYILMKIEWDVFYWPNDLKDDDNAIIYKSISQEKIQKVDRYIIGLNKILISIDQEDIQSDHPERMIGKRSLHSHSPNNHNKDNERPMILSLLYYLISSNRLIQITKILCEDLVSKEFVFLSFLQLFQSISRLIATFEEELSQSAQRWMDIVCPIFTMILNSIHSMILWKRLKDSSWFTLFHLLQLLINQDSLQGILCQSSIERKNDDLFFLSLCKSFLQGYFENCVLVDTRDDKSPIDQSNCVAHYFITGNYCHNIERTCELQCFVFHFINVLTKCLISCSDNEQQEISCHSLRGLLFDSVQLFFPSLAENTLSVGTKSNVLHQSDLWIMLPELFYQLSNNDNTLIQFLKIFLELEMRLRFIANHPLHSDSSKLTLEAHSYLENYSLHKYQSDYFFFIFLVYVFHLDHEAIVDLITNNETCCLQYLLLFFKQYNISQIERSLNEWNDSIIQTNRINEVPLEPFSVNDGNYLVWKEEFIGGGTENGGNLQKKIADNGSLCLLRDVEQPVEAAIEPSVSFQQRIEMTEIVRFLVELANQLERLYSSQVIPFNPQVLCKRIRAFLKPK